MGRKNKVITQSVQPRHFHTDFLLSRGKSWKLCPGERVLPGEDGPVLALEPGEQPSTL